MGHTEIYERYMIKIKSIKDSAAKATSNAKEFVNSEAGIQASKGIGSFLRSITSNRYVVNTMAAGVGGALVGYFTFLPTDLCMTIAMIFGFYNTLTSR